MQIVAALLTALLSWALPIVRTVLVGLGIGYVTYQGMDILLGQVQAHFFGLLGGLPSTMLQILGLGGIDKCCNILFSAFAARLVLDGVSGGAMKSWRLS